jgi:signal transduction histidine kinase
VTPAPDEAAPPERRAADQRAALVFRRAMVFAVTLGFLVLIAVSVITLVLVARDRDYTGWVNHTYEVEHQLSEFRTQLERTETAERGFLLTGDVAYLDAYERSAEQLPKLAGVLSQLTHDNPVEIRNVALLQDLLRQVLTRQQAALEAVRGAAGQAVDPATLIRSNQAFISHIRQVAAAMVAEEARLLDRRTGVQGLNAEILGGVVLASGLMLAGIGFAAFLLMRRYAEDLGRSQAALRTLNEGLEDAVRARTTDLMRANEEIQRFAYIVSHDLRAPLVNVMGFTSELEVAMHALQTLSERVEAEAPQLMSADARAAVEQDLPESIRFIRSSTQKMDRLINAILKLSREGRRVLNVEPLSMQAVLEGVVASVRHQADERGAVVEIAPDLPDLRSDRLAVEQVFGNVVENALKYLKPGRPGQVRVSGRVAGLMNVYEIADNGRGIDPKDHERVFELFRRAGAQDQPGEGIGLAHVRALITRMGGVITLQSALDQGTTFRISLPRSISSSQDAAA